jgi:hypothetical protein
MVFSEGTTEKSQVTQPGMDPGTARLVAQRPNYYANLGPYCTFVDSSLNSWKHFWTCNRIFIPTITRCDNTQSRWATEKSFSFFCSLDIATSTCYAIWLKTCIQLRGWEAGIWASYETKVCNITGTQPKRFLVVNTLPPKFSTWNQFRFSK